MRGVSSTTTRTTTKTALDLSRTDVRMARRVVGYLEYGNALDSLGQLVAMSDTQDRQAIDAIISDRDEFCLFCDLPPGFETSLENGSSDSTSLKDAKRGLGWVMALARVEFGAIVAGFTDHPEPYMFVSPDAYAYSETMQLLLEGVTSHYQSLQDEEAFGDYMKKNDSVQGALTVSRRVRIARSMLRPMMQPERSRYSSGQASQLERTARDLDGAQVAVNSAITQYLSMNDSRYVDEKVTQEFVNACGIQVAAEKREIAAGTARITRYPTESQKSQGGPAESGR